MLTDYHVHTKYSDDSEYPMEEVVRDAIALGLSEICFTDHVDYGIKRDWDDPRGMEYRRGGPGEPERMPVVNVNYPEYAAEFAGLKERYKDQITLKMGMEFGMQTHTILQYEKLFAAYPFDFIILSVHQVEDKEFWTQDFQKGRTQEEYNLRYYEEIHGKGIEINTSSHRYGLSDLTPSRDILRLYRDLGGEVITIGSDSHKKEHLGAFVRETMEEMKMLGFKAYYTFDKMIPEPHYFKAPLT